MSDEALLRALNEQYLKAYMTADVGWYEQHLAPEFVCHTADGSVLDRAQFLDHAANGPDVSEYRLERVRIRLEGDLAAVDGTGSFTRADGLKGISRYTDMYRRVDGGWKAISAEYTRTLQAAPATAS